MRGFVLALSLCGGVLTWTVPAAAQAAAEAGLGAGASSIGSAGSGRRGQSHRRHLPRPRQNHQPAERPQAHDRQDIVPPLRQSHSHPSPSTGNPAAELRRRRSDREGDAARRPSAPLRSAGHANRQQRGQADHDVCGQERHGPGGVGQRTRRLRCQAQIRSVAPRRRHAIVTACDCSA